MNSSRRFFFVLLAVGIFVPQTSADVLTFESLPVNAGGFYNGDINAGSPLRDNYSIVGTGVNFGSVETRQLWTADGIQFNNNYTEDFGSWSGWSSSNVQDATTPGFGNQYAAFPGGGSDGAGGVDAGGTYAVAFGQNAFINLPDRVTLDSVDLTNTTYAGQSIRTGDSFAKRFGGATGDDPDTFSVTLTGFDAIGGLAGAGSIVSAITVYLADFTFVDNTQDTLLDTWNNVDLTSLAGSRSVGLTFASTDFGSFGINTPLYVAIDNLAFSTASVPEPSSFAVLAGFGLAWFGRRYRRRKAAQDCE